VGFCLGEGQEIDWIGHTEYSETRIEQLDHIFNLIGINPKNPNGGKKTFYNPNIQKEFDKHYTKVS
ncbi:hypothetical protein, partial [Aeromonas caviae]|uniref:hypothetical protein n=1 Tax=Aeromonas caviae TaxID=648 RepID=UPI001FB95195